MTVRLFVGQTRCRETFVNGQTQWRKGKVSTSPKEREREKEKSRKRFSRTRWTAQVGRFWPLKRPRVECVGDVQEHDDGFEMPRADRAAHVFCVHSSKNVMSECPEVPNSSGKVVSGVQGSEEPAGTHELKPDRSTGEVLLAVGCRDDRLLTLEVLCPRAQWIMQRRFPQKKSMTVRRWKFCWEDHSNNMVIKRKRLLHKQNRKYYERQF